MGRSNRKKGIKGRGEKVSLPSPYLSLLLSLSLSLSLPLSLLLSLSPFSFSLFTVA